MKIIRTNANRRPQTFRELNVGDVFRYRMALADDNVYIKTGEGSHRSNAVMLKNGALYEIGGNADIVLQKTEVTVQDA